MKGQGLVQRTKGLVSYDLSNDGTEGVVCSSSSVQVAVGLLHMLGLSGHRRQLRSCFIENSVALVYRLEWQDAYECLEIERGSLRISVSEKE
jgi:hypothetical protein